MSIRPHFSLKRSFALALPVAFLGGCVSFGTKAPPQLLTVHSNASVAAGQSITSTGLPSLAVSLPDVPRKLATTRVPVQVDTTSVAYVKDAQWTEAPRDLFQRLLSETLASDGTVFLINEDASVTKPQKRLSGELLDFGVDAQSKQAIVTYDATLTDTATGASTRRRFTAQAPVGDIKANSVASPINQAANTVAAEVAAWVKGN